MSNSQASSAPMQATAAPSPALSATPEPRLSMRGRMALKMLESLPLGTLELSLPDGSKKVCAGRVRPQALFAQLVIHDLSALDMAVSRGDIGFGEGYMQGLWSTPDLSAVLRLCAANRASIEKLIYGQWWSTWIDQVRHLLRSNRKSQARKNISAHYDLGNSFYALFLDPTMTYSSALFGGSQSSITDLDLEHGQLRKIDRALDQLGIDRLDANAQVLEIGCGWGGLANRLVNRSQARYVGLTLSTEQRKWAFDLLKAHGPRIDIRLQDYRDVDDQFDAIVSIEMFEAVGQAYWDAYFKAVAKNLKPNGQAVIQTITIDDKLFERYRRGTDFIQQYIFPGGMLPSPRAFEQHAKAQGLEVSDVFYFGQDYAKTLACWKKNFDNKHDVVQSQGFGPEFCRMWQFYLSYCEAGFAENNINVAQFTLRKKT
jgi:cyclopropane-fatty-acyl-phospholipid synthase